MISMKRFILTLLCFLCFGIAFGNEPSVVSGEYIIDDWKIYISEEGNISIMDYKGSSENVAIPDNFDGFPVVSIGEKAFQNKGSLLSVTIPDSVTLIDWYAFESCSKLKSVVIGKSVETISKYAFSDCESLEKIVIPDSVKIIKESAFYRCVNLTSVVIPDSVKDIHFGAFSDCERLTDFTIGKSVLSFDYSRIINRDTLHTITLKNAGTDLINVPSSVQVIKPKAKSLREQMQERNDK